MKMIIAGGGTGGHLFPGIAIARELIEQDSSNEVMFIGTEKGIEKRVVPKEGFPISYIDISGIKGKSVGKVLSALIKLPLSVLQSMRHIIRFKPDVVLGVGGYSSGPVCLSAFLLRKPVVIHEQNMFPGMTTSILGKFAKVILVSFEGTKKSFEGRNVKYVGNPIRKDILAGKEKSDVDTDFTIFVFGGSQGAHAINQAVLDALPLLADIKENVNIIHQTGVRDYEIVQEGYQENNFKGEVSPFIDDMATAYSRADLVISRSGGSALAEITAVGKPAILIPFPYATENHQYFNAMDMVEGGAAKLILDAELTGEKLAVAIKELIHEQDALVKMSRESKKLGKPKAADEIIKICKELLEKA